MYHGGSPASKPGLTITCVGTGTGVGVGVCSGVGVGVGSGVGSGAETDTTVDDESSEIAGVELGDTLGVGVGVTIGVGSGVETGERLDDESSEATDVELSVTTADDEVDGVGVKATLEEDTTWLEEDKIRLEGLEYWLGDRVDVRLVTVDNRVLERLDKETVSHRPYFA